MKIKDAEGNIIEGEEVVDETQTQVIDPAPKGDQVPGSWDEIFTHPRFKTLNERAVKAEASLKEETDKQTAAEKQALEDQNKFKELYEKEVEDHKATQGTLGSRDRDALRSTIATEFGLSPEMASRLAGEDDAALRLDAEALAETLGIEQDEESKRKRKVRGIPPANKNRSKQVTYDLESMSPEEIRKNKADIWSAGQEGRIEE